MKKKILFLLDNSFTNDRRVYREAQTLVKAGYPLTIIAVNAPNVPESEIIDGICVKRIFTTDIQDIKKSKCFNTYATEITNNFQFDIVHAHDQTMLNLAVEIKKLKPTINLIYDSHELFHAWPLNVSNYGSIMIFIKSLIVRKIQIFREKRNRKQIDYIITVNQSLAKDLNHYLQAKNDVTILRNLPEKSLINEKSSILREKFNISDSKRILVFIGANIYRHTLNIEQVMAEFSTRIDVALVFICGFNANSKPVMKYVKERNYSNIYFHDLIKPNEIAHYLSSADVGLVPTWNKKDLSYWYALDNKLFEYIQAGIPVLATQQPEYIEIIDNYKCGLCVNPDSENAYVDGFDEIMRNHQQFTKNVQAAKEILCWENEEKKLTDLYEIVGDE